MLRHPATDSAADISMAVLGQTYADELNPACCRDEAETVDPGMATGTTPGTATPSQASHLQMHGLKSQITPTQLQRRKAGAGLGFKRLEPRLLLPQLPTGNAEAAAAASAVSPVAAHKCTFHGGERAYSASPQQGEDHSLDARLMPQLELHQRLTMLSLEVFSLSRGQLLPDPAVDSIVAIAYAIHDDDIAFHRRVLGGTNCSSEFRDGLVVGIILVAKPSVECSTTPLRLPQRGASFDCPTAERLAMGLGLGRRVLVAPVDSEVALLWAVAALVREWDADILVGYDVEVSACGFVRCLCLFSGLILTNAIRSEARLAMCSRELAF